jgi:hypothetical protein
MNRFLPSNKDTGFRDERYDPRTRWSILHPDKNNFIRMYNRFYISEYVSIGAIAANDKKIHFESAHGFLWLDTLIKWLKSTYIVCSTISFWTNQNVSLGCQSLSRYFNWLNASILFVDESIVDIIGYDKIPPTRYYNVPIYRHRCPLDLDLNWNSDLDLEDEPIFA